MPVKIEAREILEQKEIKESLNCDYPFDCLASQSESESEIKWIKLHQMFDK